MKLNIKAMALSLGIISCIMLILTGIANLIWPEYGSEFLKILSSIYPGYKASGTITDLVSGALYALVDGGLLGLLFAWLYNRFA